MNAGGKNNCFKTYLLLGGASLGKLYAKVNWVGCAMKNSCEKNIF